MSWEGEELQRQRKQEEPVPLLPLASVAQRLQSQADSSRQSSWLSWDTKTPATRHPVDVWSLLLAPSTPGRAGHRMTSLMIEANDLLSWYARKSLSWNSFSRYVHASSAREADLGVCVVGLEPKALFSAKMLLLCKSRETRSPLLERRRG